MKVLVCGSRDWIDGQTIKRELQKLPSASILIHGDCRGADKLSGYVGRQLGFEIRAYPANWGKYGSRAGPFRNQQMVDEEHRPEEPIDLVLAFHDDLGLGKGTADMKRRVLKAEIKFQHHTSIEYVDPESVV